VNIVRTKNERDSDPAKEIGDFQKKRLNPIPCNSVMSKIIIGNVTRLKRSSSNGAINQNVKAKRSEPSTVPGMKEKLITLQN
jgi:hypothetical protein